MRGNILVVEDEPDLRAIWSDFLTARGFDVHTASSRADLASELASGFKPQVAFVDWSLPDGTGADAAEMIQAAAPACAIVLATGHQTTPRLPIASEILVKPFSLRRLDGVLRRLLPAATSG